LNEPVFERFSNGARQVVVVAQEEARALRHNHIGTEHLLLGLLIVDGIALTVLQTMGFTAPGVRAEVARVVPAEDDVAIGQIAFTPRAKKVLELALREALSLGHNYIGTEHILLGLVRERDGVAAQVLSAHADLESVRAAIIETLSRKPPRLMRDPGKDWAYRVIEPFAAAELTGELLATRGGDGWELVAVVGPPDMLRAVYKAARMS
jgi:ATP-dependent Clp protease ATP-binding subunit ClpA